MKSFLGGLLAGIPCSLVLLLGLQSSWAGSATWDFNPPGGDWNYAANWTPATVPNGPADIATFDASCTRQVFLQSAADEVDGIVFTAAASGFTVNIEGGTFTLSNVGVTNHSGISQHFAISSLDENGAQLSFTNSATAGSLTVFTNVGGHVTDAHVPSPDVHAVGGLINFFDTSSAGEGTFINKGSSGEAIGGAISFFDSSSAANGTFLNDGGSEDAGGSTNFRGDSSAANGTFINRAGKFGDGASGRTVFADNSSAGHGTFLNKGAAANFDTGGRTIFSVNSTADNGTFMSDGASSFSGAGGGTVEFDSSSSAGNATLIANGGVNGGVGGAIFFFDDSTGGSARVKVFGNGSLSISNPLGVTVGSIEGNGTVLLWGNSLTVGSNNLNTRFSGIIDDGSLVKIGTGVLVLSNANIYLNGTTIKDGELVVNNRSGSGTGDGPVQVLGGILAGRGTINGSVTVGTGYGAGAILAPGKLGGNPCTLNIRSTR